MYIKILIFFCCASAAFAQTLGELAGENAAENSAAKDAGQPRTPQGARPANVRNDSALGADGLRGGTGGQGAVEAAAAVESGGGKTAAKDSDGQGKPNGAGARKNFPSITAQTTQISGEDFDKIFAEASGGDASAQLIMGVLYARGIKPAVSDIKMAVEWLEKSAKGGNRGAMNFLGAIYGDKRLGMLDYKKAIYWRELAASGGSAAEKYALANSYIYAYMLPADQNKALYWLKQAAEAGHPDAINQLISIYTNRGDAQQVKYWKQEKNFAQLKLAQNGDPAAMYEVYRKYIGGKGGFYKSIPKAIYWLKKSSDAGYIPACQTLSSMYIEGRYVSRNIDGAIPILERIAKVDPNSALKLSEIYAQGEKADIQKSRKWLDFAASGMNSINKIHLAWKLWAGAGLQKNLEKARELCAGIKEAEKGGQLAEVAARMLEAIDAGKDAPSEFGSVYKQM